MSEANSTQPSVRDTSRIVDKQLATLSARAALAGGQLVAIVGDNGRVELIFTDGPMTLRADDPQVIGSVLAARTLF